MFRARLFIFCWVVSLVASRCFAQSDSVELQLDYSIGTFNWSLVATSLCAPPATITGSINLSLQYSGLVRHHFDTVRTDNVYINLDTVHQELALSILNQGAVPTCGGGRTCITYLNYCGIGFNQIPYTIESDGTIRACGQYSTEAHAGYGGVFSSGCRDPLGASNDSLWNTTGKLCLSIVMMPQAGIRDHSQAFSGIVLHNKHLLASTKEEGIVVIRDIIGRTVATQYIPTASVELPVTIQWLPPGCYFARLTSASGSSEVVKFVVAP